MPRTSMRTAMRRTRSTTLPEAAVVELSLAAPGARGFMRRILGSLLVVYTFTVCFGDAYKLHTWLPVPLAVLLLGLVVAAWAVLLTPRVPLDRGLFPSFDLLLVAYVLDLGVSLLLSGSIEPTNIHHLIAYSTVVGLYYCFVKFLFAADGVYVTYETRIRTALALSVLL